MGLHARPRFFAVQRAAQQLHELRLPDAIAPEQHESILLKNIELANAK